MTTGKGQEGQEGQEGGTDEDKNDCGKGPRRARGGQERLWKRVKKGKKHGHTPQSFATPVVSGVAGLHGQDANV